MRLVFNFHHYFTSLSYANSKEEMIKACCMHFNGLLHSIKRLKTKDFASKYCMDECIENAFYFLFKLKSL